MMIALLIVNPQTFRSTIFTKTVSSVESGSHVTIYIKICDLFRVFGILSLERQLYVGGSRNFRFGVSNPKYIKPKLSAWFNGITDRLKINMSTYNLVENSSLQRPGLQG